MGGVKEFTETERESLYELTSIGASHASSAFAMLLGRAMAPSAPMFHEADEYRADESWTTGVIFRADGELSGLVAILLSTASREVVTERLVRWEEVGDSPQTAESALRELGNIVASHTMSAIADKLGGRILLSVPLLVMEDADSEFASMIRESGAERCVECELTDSAREINVRLVFVPGSKS
ncbi:MAG: chemotaxis protein CheC [Deltaproteobacteria bacterium]|nr:chemotaxis protein CheC [Deltaproteobacteria bacterium]